MSRNTIYAIITAILAVGGVWSSCGGDAPPGTPDVSQINVDLRFQRFDQDLFALDTNNLEASLPALAREYPDFLPFFLNEIAHDPSRPDETPLEALEGFVTAPQVRRLQDSCQAAYANLNWLQADLMQLVRYYRYYFPDRPQPRFVTTVTEFIGDAYAVNDSLVMIGLDMFLGPDFSGYNPDFFPYYLRRQFNQEYIVPKVALALASRIVGPPPGEKILDHMINNGKILYLVGSLAPAVPDSIRMGYTREQMEGCYVNEQEVWARLLDMEVLYQPLSSRNRKIVEPSPSADNVFQEAPGEIGNWIGLRIVEAYMRRYPDRSVSDLLAQRDAQAFLQASKYKPKRMN